LAYCTPTSTQSSQPHLNILEKAICYTLKFQRSKNLLVIYNSRGFPLLVCAKSRPLFPTRRVRLHYEEFLQQLHGRIVGGVLSANPQLMQTCGARTYGEFTLSNASSFAESWGRRPYSVRRQFLVLLGHQALPTRTRS
jgi:hypothetical protein